MVFLSSVVRLNRVHSGSSVRAKVTFQRNPSYAARAKKLLRHKRIENTMKCISMIHFEEDEFEVTTATTVEEAKQALSVGFNYITEKNGIMLFRRPKRFCGINAKFGV